MPWTPQDHWSEARPWQEAVAEMAAAHSIDVDWARHLLRIHGSRAEAILALAQGKPDAAQPLCPHQPFRMAEVLFAIRNEMALCLGDWYFRRSTMAFAPCHGSEAVEDIADLFAAELGWSTNERNEQILRLRGLLADATVTPAPASNR